MTIQKQNSHDTTIDEIHRVRREISDKFGGDITAILEDAQKRQEVSGRPIWRSTTADKVNKLTGSPDETGGDDHK